MKFYVFYIIWWLILLFTRKIITLSTTETTNNTKTFKFLVQGGFRPEKHNLAKYVVSIRFGTDNKYFGTNHMCGGTIIKPNCILTAAHCVYKPGIKKQLLKRWQINVVAGTVNRLEETSTTQVIAIEKIIANRAFEFKEMVSDVAVLKLKQDINIDGTTRDVMDIIDKPVTEYTKCTIVGWGRLFYNGPMPAEVVYGDIFILPNAKCKQHLQKYYKEGMICADDESDLERSGCMGDSGGPLFCENKVVGITSFGINDQKCGGDRPTVFTDVYYFRDWIIENFTQRRKISVMLLVIPSIISLWNLF